MRRNRRQARESERARQQFRERLAALRHTFSYAGRQESAERLRRGAARAFLAHRGPGAWSRLLALEGPESDAWLGLARAHAAGGASEAALTCAAEAVRCGHAPEALLPEIARLGLGTRAGAEGLAAGTPAAVVAEVFAATPDEPAGLGTLYQALGQADLPYVLRALLLRRLFTRIGDSEELARQRERLRAAEPVGPDLAEWLETTWCGLVPLEGDEQIAPGSPMRRGMEQRLDEYRHLLGADADGSVAPGGQGLGAGELEALRRRVKALRAAAAPETLDEWVIEANSLDRLEERPDRPESTVALHAVLHSQPERLLPLLGFALLRPTTRWLGVVERILDENVRRIGASELNAVLRRLTIMHRLVEVQDWLGAYRRQVADWVETLWPPTGPATS